jgi:hypothetical protein
MRYDSGRATAYAGQQYIDFDPRRGETIEKRLGRDTQRGSSRDAKQTWRISFDARPNTDKPSAGREASSLDSLIARRKFAMRSRGICFHKFRTMSNLDSRIVLKRVKRIMI